MHCAHLYVGSVSVCDSMSVCVGGSVSEAAANWSHTRSALCDASGDVESQRVSSCLHADLSVHLQASLDSRVPLRTPFLGVRVKSLRPHRHEMAGVHACGVCRGQPQCPRHPGCQPYHSLQGGSARQAGELQKQNQLRMVCSTWGAARVIQVIITSPSLGNNFILVCVLAWVSPNQSCQLTAAFNTSLKAFPSVWGSVLGIFMILLIALGF